MVLSLDEFQDIQGLQVIETILAQARSFGLGLILSHQTTAQLDEKKLKIILSNCAVQCAGRDDAVRIKKEIIQTLTTQADYRWSFRFRAEPGQESPPPLLSVSLEKPPIEKHSWDEVQRFIEDQKARYGYGVVERPLLAQKEKEGMEWIEYSTVIPIPEREEWLILNVLRDRALNQTKIAEETGIDRNKIKDIIERLHKEEKIKVARSDRSLNRYYTLTENGYNIIPSLDYNDYAEIGGSDVQELAIEFVRYALGKGWFVAIGKQGMRERKPDLVAFDYEKQESIAVEIESTDHITHSHPEQVKRHMLEIEPFSRMIIAFIVLMIPPFIHYGFGTPLVGHSYVDLSFTIRDLIAGIVFMIGISLLIRPSIPKLSK